MNLRILGWAIALVVGVMLSACHVPHANLGNLTSMGKVTPSSGGVTILRGGTPVAAMRGVELEAGDVVETDANSTAVIDFIDGSATLMPKTKVTVGSIWTWFGKVFFSGPVDNDTEYTNMSVEGTEYLSEVQSDRLVVTVLAGHVRVSSKTGAFAPVAVGAREQLEVTSLKSVGGAPPTKRTITQDELNTLVEELNAAQQAQSGLVPDVTGLSQEQATQKLSALGLDPKIEKHPAQEDQIGKVFSQSPAPGTRSTSVLLAVGARAVHVPDLRGLTLDQAKNLLPAGVELGRQDFEATGTQPLDRILRQNPAAGKAVVEGSHVDVVIEALIMPDLRGKTIQQAQEALRPLGVKLGTREQPDAKRVGVVLSQNPAPGTRLEPARPVELVVGAQPVTPGPVSTQPGAARLVLSSSYLVFQGVAGNKTSQELKLENQGNAPLVVKQVNFSPETKDYQVSSVARSCSQLAPGAACILSVTYQPSSPGKHSTTLRVESNDPAGVASVEISGVATSGD